MQEIRSRKQAKLKIMVIHSFETFLSLFLNYMGNATHKTVLLRDIPVRTSIPSSNLFDNGYAALMIG
jgi:hypothetical protein